MTAHDHRHERPDRDNIVMMSGIVRRIHAGDLHEIECHVGAMRRTVLAKRSGKMYGSHIRICVGDVVKVEVSAFDTTRGRIVWRE